MLRPLQGRHALKELGVSWGRFRPLRDQRLQEPALLGFRFEPNTGGEFRTCCAEIVAPAAHVIAICGSHEVNRISVRRASSCDPNVCGMHRTRIVAGLSRAVTAAAVTALGWFGWLSER
jgi:hypothetical protein